MTFDERAREWDDNPIHRDRTLAIADAIRRLAVLDPPPVAFEYGCGTGQLSFALLPQLSRVVLADTSEGMLEVVREKIAAAGRTDTMRAIRLDLTADPLPSERFGLAYSAMTLHHVPNTAAALRQFCALLEPGGQLCIADLDKEDGSFHGPDVDVHHGFNREELAVQLAEAGFADIRFETVYEIVKDVPEGMRAFPVFLMVARKP